MRKPNLTGVLIIYQRPGLSDMANLYSYLIFINATYSTLPTVVFPLFRYSSYICYHSILPYHATDIINFLRQKTMNSQ